MAGTLYKSALEGKTCMNGIMRKRGPVYLINTTERLIFVISLQVSNMAANWELKINKNGTSVART
jgi:hypothetical protein